MTVPWPPAEMAELLEALARSADRNTLSYSETAHLARHGAETIRRLRAELLSISEVVVRDAHRGFGGRMEFSNERLARIDRLVGRTDENTGTP